MDDPVLHKDDFNVYVDNGKYWRKASFSINTLEEHIAWAPLIGEETEDGYIMQGHTTAFYSLELAKRIVELEKRVQRLETNPISTIGLNI